MNQEELKSTNESMYNQTPIIGGLIRRGSAIGLAEDGSLQALQFLAEALHKSTDQGVKDVAYERLQKVSKQEEIDAIFETWLKTRGRRLTELLTQKKWRSSYLPTLNVITNLTSEELKLIQRYGKEIINPLLKAFIDKDSDIINNVEEMRSFLEDPMCKSLIYFMTEQWEQYEQIDFDQNILKNIFNQVDPILRRKITEKIKISGRSDWLLAIVTQGKEKNIELMTDYDWQVTIELLRKTDNDLEKWKLARQAPPFYSQQLIKQIQCFNTINGEKSHQKKLLNLGKKVIAHLSSLNSDKSKPITVIGHNYRSIDTILMNNKGNFLASFSEKDSTLKFWRLPSGELLNTCNLAYNTHLKYLKINKQGTFLVSALNVTTGKTVTHIELWELLSGELIREIYCSNNSIDSIVMNTEGTILAVSEEKIIKLWELPSGKLLKNLTTGHTDSIFSLQIDHKGTLLLSGSKDKTIKIWNLPSGRLINTFTIGNVETDGNIGFISFASNGRFILNDDATLLIYIIDDNWSEKTIKIWNLPYGKLLNTFTINNITLDAPIIFNSRYTLVAFAVNNNIELREFPSGKLLKTLTGHTGIIDGLQIDEKDNFIASSSYDKTIKLWELSSGDLLNTINTGDKSYTIHSLVINIEGTFVATGYTYYKEIKSCTFELYSLDRLPLSKIIKYYDYIQDNLKRDDLNENQRNYCEFMLALVNHYRK